MLYHGVAPAWPILLAPAVVALVAVLASAIALATAALQVRFRDVGLAMPLLLQVWMFLSPVVYPYSQVPVRFRPLYQLNPMAGLIEAFRRVTIQGQPPDWHLLLISALVSAALLSLRVTCTSSTWTRRLPTVCKAMVDLSLRHVSKRYRLEDALPPGTGLARRLASRVVPHRHDFWALRDVSLDVQRGETIGVIGHNGAGKSTLLKLLSRITAPTEGEIRIRGRLSALIELGSGFHPELTGRENLFLSGAILGMRRREIVAKLQSIVDFAGVNEFIDVPVKWYSSGMYVRLGFAMAAHLDPDVLLVDEVLSVGDASFQGRCFARIAELKQAGTTIVLISHDLGSVERLSDRAVLLNHGRVAAMGRPSDVISTYQKSIDAKASAEPEVEERRPIEIRALRLLDIEGREVSTARTGDPLLVRIEFEAATRVERPVFDVYFYTYQDGLLEAQCSSAADDRLGAAEGRGTVEFHLPALGLQPGAYTIGVTVKDDDRRRPVDWRYGRATLYVTEGRGVGGHFFMPHTARLIGGGR